MIPDLLLTLLYVIFAVMAAAGLGTYLLARRAAQKVRSFRVNRSLPRLTARPVRPARVEEGADLLAYPRKLESLEQKLGDRHRAVQEQAMVLDARLVEVQQKPGREELVRKYQQDVALLRSRAASMRRVLAMVWKTRAVLLFRAHLAITARRRPQLGKMPDPSAPNLDLRSAQQTFHAAASAVKFYMDVVKERAAELPQVRPDVPLAAEVDPAIEATILHEQERTAAAYADLVEDMDRLCDHLTWFGDHLASRATLDGGNAEPGISPDSGPLLEEVDKALRELSELSRSMDPMVADDAVANLESDIGKLEESGLEAEAEARAQLEVEKLLKEGDTWG